jgi:hypothetical protein
MQKIGTIENYYGGLFVKEFEGLYFWGIMDSKAVNKNEPPIKWEQIPKDLYINLIFFDKVK